MGGERAFSDFLLDVKSGKVSEVLMGGSTFDVVPLGQGPSYTTTVVPSYTRTELMATMAAMGIKFAARKPGAWSKVF